MSPDSSTWAPVSVAARVFPADSLTAVAQIKEKDDKIEALEKGRAAAAADPPAAPPAAVAAPSDAAMAPGEKISDADALRARVEEAIKVRLA